MIALGIDWYGEWVPSKANVADIMTRPEGFHELALALPNIERIELVLPPINAEWEALVEWARRMRAERGVRA